MTRLKLVLMLLALLGGTTPGLAQAPPGAADGNGAAAADATAMEGADGDVQALADTEEVEAEAASETDARAEAAATALTDAERAVLVEEAGVSVQQRLADSTRELKDLTERAREELSALRAELREHEAELRQVREKYDAIDSDVARRINRKTNLKKEVEAREKSVEHLTGLISDYLRDSFNSHLTIAERSKYEPVIEDAIAAAGDEELTRQQIFSHQFEVVFASLERLKEAMGGARFEGTAIDESGREHEGMFAIIGPAVYFRSDDGQVVGVVDEVTNSTERNVFTFPDPALADAAARFIADGRGSVPVDPTQGEARVMEQTEETLWEHIQAGGPVMVPIFALAGAALLVAIYKWIALTFVRRPSQKRIDQLLDAVGRQDRPEAERIARKMKGPAGTMLHTGVEHLDEPRDLIEEIMYERVLVTRLRVQRLLPFIAITAAAAPLLGLLGTVTGIINTFKLITAFGTGDPKMLSGGISEALVTTEFGLIVAIPSLLLHAFLARKARGITDQMEKVGVAFANKVSMARRASEADPAEDPEAQPQPQPKAEAKAKADQTKPAAKGDAQPAVATSS